MNSEMEQRHAEIQRIRKRGEMSYPEIRIFFETLREGELEAAKMNRIAGITVVNGMLSIKPDAIQAAYFMRLAADGGPTKDSYSIPPEAMGISSEYTLFQLELIANHRGIELCFDE